MYHVGSSHDTHSIIQSGLIPGGKGVEKGRHAVFLTAVNRMNSDHVRERDYDLTKPRIAVYKNNWKIQQNALSWCNLRIAQSRGLQFYQTRTKAIILYNTLLEMCIEKVVIRKPAEELYNKSYQSSIAPQRMVLKPNLNYERQDTTCSDARTSFDHSDKHGGTYKETCRGGRDFRIQGLPHSAVQEHDHILKESSSEIDSPVRESPEQRSTTSTLKTQNRAFNPFSEKSKEMIHGMGNMEYFEICEITPNIQCSTIKPTSLQERQRRRRTHQCKIDS